MSLRVSVGKPVDTKKVAKVVVISQGKILLLLRKKDQAFPQHWDLPGGHLHSDETWESGAIRETKEETNLDVRGLRLVHQKGRETYFMTSDWSGEIYDAEDLPEHDAWTWLDIGEVNKLENFSDKYNNVVELVVDKLNK